MSYAFSMRIARSRSGSLRGRVGLLVALALTAPLVGCMPPQGDTKMARGEGFQTGDPKYDEFFQAVLDAKSKVEDVDGTAALKKTLADGLQGGGGSKKSMSTDELFSAAKSKAEAIKEGGGAFYVQMLPSAKLYKRGKGGDDPFAKAVEKTVSEGISRSDQLSTIAVEIEQLEEKVDGLVDGAGEAFKDPKKKDEVVAELEAARDVLAKARLKALAESGRALNFVVELARNVDTGGADTVAVAEATPPPATTKPTGGGRPVTKRVEYDH